MSPLGDGINNPGWAGETGEFKQLTEADVRGADFVGERPLDGGVGGAVCSMPLEQGATVTVWTGPRELQRPGLSDVLEQVLGLDEDRGFQGPDEADRR